MDVRPQRNRAVSRASHPEAMQKTALTKEAKRTLMAPWPGSQREAARGRHECEDDVVGGVPRALFGLL